MEKKVKGAALITVLIVFTVLAILGFSLMQLSVSENNLVMHQEKNMKAYYTARAGADAMASYIINNQSQVPYLKSQLSTDTGSGAIDGNSYEVNVTYSSWPGDVMINSTGIVNGTIQAKVSLNLTLVDSSLFKYAVFANNILSTGKNVEGDIGTNQATFSPDDDIVGNITLGPSASAANITTAQAHVTAGHTASKLTSPMTFPVIDESRFNPLGGLLPSTITLNDGEKRYLWVNDFTNDLKVTTTVTAGSGQLHLLVKNRIAFSGNPKIVTENGAKLYVYYNKTDTIDFKGTPSFAGLIYAPNASVDFRGGGNGTFYGAILSNNYNGPSSNASHLIVDDTLNVGDLLLTNARVLKRGTWGN